ncbi:MAG: hypothetical protein V4613_04685 [Bacteroidota bacterium]
MENNQQSSSEPFSITGDWDIQSIALKEKYPQLTDADLLFEAGKEDELIGRIESRLNINRSEIINILTTPAL